MRPILDAVNTSTRRTAARTLTIAALAGTLLTTGTVAGSVAATPSGPGADHEPAATAGKLDSAEFDQLARGLSHASLTLGDAGTPYSWTVQVTLPSGQEGVRESQLASRTTAQQVAAELREVGQDATAEAVVADRLADSGGYLGHRVRVGSFATEAEATAAKAELDGLGYAGGTWYEGWDGDQPDALEGGGPLAVDVLTLDPRKFQGEVISSFGPDLENPETTSELAEGALAGVNAGFFVHGAAHGAPGDLAGAAASHGEILSETVGDRPNLVIDHRSGRASIQRLTWEGRLSAGREHLELDGINRVPGKIRNCGGTDDLPTDAPKHDATCTDEDEVVVFTDEYGASTPQGEGLEVVLDRRGKVVEINRQRGTELTEGQRSVQAIGGDVARLRAFASGAKHVKLTNQYLDERGKKLRMNRHTQVVNGGPNLLTDGERDITAARDGMVHQDNPGQFYGWTHQRNPRTLAGIDGKGRLMLVTADGRQTDSIGLSISEAADLADRLGMVDAINLDGGGSTAMVVDGELENSPSGGSERAVGDALVIRDR